MKINNLPFNMFNKNKNDEVFMKLNEKKDRQPLNFSKRTKGIIALSLVTTLILSGIYTQNYLKTHKNNVYPTDSFTIISEGKELCKLREPELLDATLKKLDNRRMNACSSKCEESVIVKTSWNEFK